MPVDRMLPTPEARDLLELTRDIADKVLEPRVVECEKTGTFPDGVFPALGAAGLLGLPYPEEYGGGAQPYEVYLQMLEEVAAAWMSVGVGMSVHTMTSYAMAAFGTDEQKRRFLPDMVGGELLGAYALSEPQAGSDISGMTTRAVRDGDEYVLTGTKAWITHGSHADFYTIFARTSPDPKKGLS